MLLRAHLIVQQQTLNPVFEIVLESVKVCTTGMSSRTLYAQHPASLRIFPSLPGSRLRFFIPIQIQYSYEHTFVQQLTLNLVFEIVQGSVEVCTTGMSSRTLYTQHPVSLRIFPSLPGSRLRFLSPGKFSTLQCTVFDTLQPKLMHPLVIFRTVHTDQSKEYCFTPRGYKHGILIGQCAHFFIHPSSN